MKVFSTILMLSLFTQTAQATSPGETHGTAYTLESGNWELGVFAALRRGFNDGLEVSVHPLTAIKAPNLAIKKMWSEGSTMTIASRHSLTYATPLLQSLAKSGTGGILPADAVIPHIVALDNRFLVSRQVGGQSMLTLSARVMLGASFGESSWPSIDMPIAYPRTAAYQDTMAAALGVQFDGQFTGSLGYRIDADAWIMPLSDAKWAMEFRAHLPWRPSKHFTGQLTATGIVGDYAYGTNWHILPGFDLIWGW
jgi:hypothetical protein